MHLKKAFNYLHNMYDVYGIYASRLDLIHMYIREYIIVGGKIVWRGVGPIRNRRNLINFGPNCPPIYERDRDRGKKYVYR